LAVLDYLRIFTYSDILLFDKNIIKNIDRDWLVGLAFGIKNKYSLRDINRKKFVWPLGISGFLSGLMFLIQLIRSVEVLG
jgi:hypothetical protein